MASRRTRIKGIANIPQRRKTNISTEGEQLLATDEEIIKSSTKVDDIIPADGKVSSPDVKKNALGGELVENVPEEVIVKVVSEKVDQCVLNDMPSVETCESECTNTNSTKIEFFSSKATVQVDPPVVNVEVKKTAFSRRKFIKPTISLSALNRKPKTGVENDDNAALQSSATVEKPQIINKIHIINDQIIEPADNQLRKIAIPDNTGKKDETEVNLEETYVLPQSSFTPKDDSLQVGKGIKRLAPYVSTTHNSDTEYPAPPPSPSKINRSRIKAIPRLSQRKTSFSASESEDESRRNYNRNRNDSVCSTTSGIPDSISECMSPQRPKEFNSVIQKKCRRSEQSRKMATARHDFYGKFGNNKPDRQKLTMIDLIFYNPTTNPMSNDSKPKRESEPRQNDEIDENSQVTEDLHEPEKAVVTEKVPSDEENEMPVPQIKIGPQGEIILDEQSLVIENKETKKSREELQKSQVVDGDFDTGYGIYKRAKRAKDWTPSETLRFYKALNTIGTDFSLMCELFPRRSRRELKMKFKKEERINKNLIDRAVMQPCNFDFAELKHDVDMEEKELEEIERHKGNDAKMKLQNEERLTRKRKPTKIKQLASDTVKVEKLPKPQKIRKLKKRKALDINSVFEDSDADVSDVDSASESEKEVCLSIKPTRSGRIPKVTQKYNPLYLDTVSPKEPKKDTVVPKKVDPGSLVLIPSAGPNGKPMFKLFMVTPEQNAAQVNVNSNNGSSGIGLQSIMTISTSRTTSNLQENDSTVLAIENNITIPAEENNSVE